MFNISLAAPIHGWLPIKIDINNICLDTVASDIRNDPVAELNSLATMLHTPFCIKDQVLLWGEPEEDYLCCDSEAGSNLATVYTMREDAVLAAVKLYRDDIAGKILMAVAKISPLDSTHWRKWQAK